ncbi:MAG: C-terminal binding protein [Candidatus Adiutrix sp.]|jgi:D-3-phosphoglycerate dehydrogenase|nr:C-terminal binding protein [Candidatus Adiutrix sp.]
MARFKVVITDSPFPSPEPFFETLREAEAEVVLAENPEDRAALAALCAEADAVIVTYAQIDAELIGAMEKNRLLARTGVAVNNIDLAAATAKGIFVTNVVTAQVPDVANHAIALLLTVAKKIVLLNNLVKGGLWSLAPADPVYKLDGRVLGLAGFGNIPRAVARRARGFDLKVMAHDPYVSAEAMAEHGVEKVDFDGLIRESDYLSIHLPLTGDTRNIFGRAEFRAMKNTALLINTARGGVIDEPALVEALKSGEIAGAGLDVLSTEFPGQDHPLYKFDNVVITPHSAYLSVECVRDLQRSAALEVLRVLKGEKPVSVVNRELLSS